MTSITTKVLEYKIEELSREIDIKKNFYGIDTTDLEKKLKNLEIIKKSLKNGKKGL